MESTILNHTVNVNIKPDNSQNANEKAKLNQLA